MNIVRAAAARRGTSRTDWLIILFALAASGAALGFLPQLAGWLVAGIIAALILIGGAFWLRSGKSKQDTSAEIGRLLMFGIAAALPSLLIAHSIDQRQTSLENEFKARQRAEDLQLQVGFQGNLRGVNLSGRSLRRFQLPGRNLNGAHLEGATLTGANLAGAMLIGARLDGARLDNVNLTYANLRDASLAGADLRGAKLISAQLENTCFAPGIDEQGKQKPTNLRGAHFAGAYLNGPTFVGANLQDALFTEDLRDAGGIATSVFINANIRGAQFPPGQSPQRVTARSFRPPEVPLALVPRNARGDSVASVSDGDTLRLKTFGKAELAGEDAPTVLAGSRWGAEARRFASSKLPPGRRVRYEPVLHRNNRGDLVAEADRFGRKSIYLWRVSANDSGKGQLFNQEIMASGYAKARPAFITQQADRMKHRTADRFIARDIIESQKPARQAAFRVWSTCAGPGPVEPFALTSP